MSIKRITPKPGQESVWAYPRPPQLEATNCHLRIVYNDEVIADSNRAFRVLETSHPPTYYIPEEDFKSDALILVGGSSFCEFKGEAHYYDIQAGGKMVNRAAWGYKNPTKAFEQLKDTVSVYAHKMEACYVSDEKVQAQEGDFDGGWITKNIVGPFKGAPGTWGW